MKGKSKVRILVTMISKQHWDSESLREKCCLSSLLPKQVWKKTRGKKKQKKNQEKKDKWSILFSWEHYCKEKDNNSKHRKAIIMRFTEDLRHRNKN